MVQGLFESRHALIYVRKLLGGFYAAAVLMYLVQLYLWFNTIACLLGPPPAKGSRILTSFIKDDKITTCWIRDAILQVLFLFSLSIMFPTNQFFTSSII